MVHFILLLAGKVIGLIAESCYIFSLSTQTLLALLSVLCLRCITDFVLFAILGWTIPSKLSSFLYSMESMREKLSGCPSTSDSLQDIEEVSVSLQRISKYYNHCS